MAKQRLVTIQREIDGQTVKSQVKPESVDAWTRNGWTAAENESEQVQQPAQLAKQDQTAQPTDNPSQAQGDVHVG